MAKTADELIEQRRALDKAIRAAKRSEKKMEERRQQAVISDIGVQLLDRYQGLLGGVDFDEQVRIITRACWHQSVAEAVRLEADRLQQRQRVVGAAQISSGSQSVPEQVAQ